MTFAPVLGMLGWPDIIGILMVVGILFCAKNWPDLFRGMRQGVRESRKASKGMGGPFGDANRPAAFRPVADAITHTNQTVECDPPREPEWNDPIVVWVAQGFGVGRLRPGPGTWGSIVGLLWFAALLAPGPLWGFFGGILVSIPLCVWVCGLAEKALGERDPGSVVLDEIIAVPLCFGAWVLSVVNSTGRMPEISYFASGNHWLGVVGIFAAFRLFDIWKPWPVRQSQSLPGGWGVTVDDLLAALYVNLVSLPFLL